MMSKKSRTRQQMEEEMRQLRKVFMTVRLMKADEVQGGKKGSAPCYAQWRRSRPCENCVARQALEKNTRKTRLEYFGQELYEITASCVQVDGQLARSTAAFCWTRKTVSGCSTALPTSGKSATATR